MNFMYPSHQLFFRCYFIYWICARSVCPHVVVTISHSSSSIHSCWNKGIVTTISNNYTFILKFIRYFDLEIQVHFTFTSFNCVYQIHYRSVCRKCTNIITKPTCFVLYFLTLNKQKWLEENKTKISKKKEKRVNQPQRKHKIKKNEVYIRRLFNKHERRTVFFCVYLL